MAMETRFSDRIALFSGQNSKRLLDGLWGIEKEAQRVNPKGELALTDHPAALGDKLTESQITTDFAESQLELATSACKSIEEAYEELCQIQDKVEQVIGEELLWPLSMPPRLPEENLIPIAKFGDSEEGKRKELYRRGLALRYGKKMQMISGIHYNFSFGQSLLQLLYDEFGQGQSAVQFKSEIYTAVARNFLRYRWLLIYLFGASPAVDRSYHDVIRQEMDHIANCCPKLCELCAHCGTHTVSLRVSRFGYSVRSQVEDGRYLNDLQSYIDVIDTLLHQRSDAFRQLGLAHDTEQQMNDHVLQTESEFYSSIRLKRTPEPGESQLDALKKRGVQYAEIRILDVNPFARLGISMEQLHFLQVFMLYCLFEDSPLIREAEWEAMNRNHHLISLSGRKPGIVLEHYAQGSKSLRAWADELFAKLKPLAELLDEAEGGSKYRECVRSEYDKVRDLSLLPSARIWREMMLYGEDHVQFGVRKAAEYRQMMEQASKRSAERASKSKNREGKEESHCLNRYQVLSN